MFGNKPSANTLSFIMQFKVQRNQYKQDVVACFLSDPMKDKGGLELMQALVNHGFDINTEATHPIYANVPKSAVQIAALLGEHDLLQRLLHCGAHPAHLRELMQPKHKRKGMEIEIPPPLKIKMKISPKRLKEL